jgi:D-glycero-alpha-D-manno-heptose 1-phosphate guanylyltransferase
MTTTAILLAGGLGTRLRSVVADLPKPMAPVCNKPFLHYVFAQLQQAGITHVVLSVGYKWETISAYFGNKYDNITIDYCIETEPLGTGGAIKAALHYCNTNNVAVLNGDSIFNFDLKSFLASTAQAPVLMAVRAIDNASRYGTISINTENTITQFIEKTGLEQAGIINTGIYLINKNHFFNNCPVQDKFSIEQDYFAHIVTHNQIQGVLGNGYFIDIGIPEDFARAQTEFQNLTVS